MPNDPKVSVIVAAINTVMIQMIERAFLPGIGVSVLVGSSLTLLAILLTGLIFRAKSAVIKWVNAHQYKFELECRYTRFRSRAKSGSVSPERFEEQARRVIK